MLHSGWLTDIVSDDVRCMIESMVIADSGANLSDHRAVIGHFKLQTLSVVLHQWQLRDLTQFYLPGGGIRLTQACITRPLSKHYHKSHPQYIVTIVLYGL